MKILKSWAPYLAIILLVVFLRTFIITPVRVDGKSMNPTLENGQILLLEKINSNYKRFDIVVINYEENGQTEKLIKRIIGLPGETVEIKDNKIYIDEVEINDDYAYGETSDYEKITLDDDEYFILGDNRLISKDSRYFGPVKKDDLMGEAVFRLWPFSSFGLID